MDNGNRTLCVGIFNRMQNFPPLTVRGNNIGRTWCAWKQKFLSFLQKEDSKELYKSQWTVILLMLIGPVGEKAYKNLPQNKAIDQNQTKDLETVLRELDLHFIFGLRKKQDNESIDNYIDSLTLVALASNHSNPMNVVKEKIIEDIKNYNFMEKAMLFVRFKGDLISYLQSLDLHKITQFWQQCEKLMSSKNHEDIQRQFPCNSQSEIECVRCGTHHSRNRCPAHGLQCDNCKGYNHFTDKCKVKFVSDCTKCGTHHVQSRCLAFGELCTNCGKMNHFSWLCQVPVVKNCPRCGRDHAISMCPAQGHVCSKCKKPNHFKEKCLSK
ncbi:uncharacterized protein LOC105829518 [Monomorium pharaonis]|uniref:uncharacterized protein LOC105829518 n=1 Tax=Monomorium pharaonis TaxID=307658 RepID=UPI00063FAE4F|nr:uncharacterized protein LOC105829518 [Monomorium pharaonis]XP_036150856.1 uncharacterized protein LOC105829518 [Monomorium pharaonis]XP_036150857.1 uncharacterized protein LOC105829518 [Monomorium pharaonis]XP_036150858.1 uncharacterized protein LOC105829518 [Monomorium pharaonis]